MLWFFLCFPRIYVEFTQLQRLYPIKINTFLQGMLNSSAIQNFDKIRQLISLIKKTGKFGAVTLWLRGLYINFALTSAVLRSPRSTAVVNVFLYLI